MLYQTEKPMVLFIAKSLEDICLFTSSFILGKKFKATKTCLTLSKITFKDSSFHKRATHVNSSILIKIDLSELKKSRETTDTQFLKFKSDVVFFLSALCAHLVKKSPLKYSLTRNA